MVKSILPKEETIKDPLYEPLKLNRYELCPHLTMLGNVSHLRYGFSPYLLFDVERWMAVVKVIRSLFGSGTEVEEELDKDDITEESKKSREVEKGDKTNIFDNFVKFSREFEEGINDYFDYSEKLPDRKERNGYYKELKAERDKIKERYYLVKKEYKRILNDFLYQGDEFNKNNFNRISYFFRLDYPVKVKCPRCEKNPYMFMCEEGKIYSMKEALLRTFELRRAKWLFMSGSLHTVHRASTHTRLSHQIGSVIAGVNALREIDVYPCGDMSMSLGAYLLMRGEMHEFLMANFLHDIGHSPLSHVLEPNPFIGLDHEEITRNLIYGAGVKGWGDKMDWYVAERYLLKMKVIKNFENRFFENRYDPIYDVDVFEAEGRTKEEQREIRRKEFLNYLKYNDEILESEIVTVSEVLGNFGVAKDRVVDILRGSDGGCGHEVVGTEREKIYDTEFLNKLIESEIDIDRMDHVKRDSVVCGLSLTSFRLLELLGSMSVVLPSSRIYNDVYVNSAETETPYIFVSEDGLSYVMDLLNSRREIFNNVMFSDENNWVNGVVNQITALAVRYLPHIKNMLPYITDQMLIHFYTNDLFLGTQIEKLNRLFHGEMDCSGYDMLMRYKLKDKVIVTENDLKKIYSAVGGTNDGYGYLELPAVVFYTNIKPPKCPECKVGKLRKGEESGKYSCMKCGEITRREIEDNEKNKLEKKKSWSDMIVYEKKFKIGNEMKYRKFKDLAARKYQGTSLDIFPGKPNELDVKNLLYIWVSNFVITTDSTKTNGCKSKEKWKEGIKKDICGIWADDGGKFDNMFVDLDAVEEAIN